MSVVGPEYLKLSHTERQRHTYALSTHTSLSPPSRLILSLPLGFSVLAHDERQADANERKQDSFSSIQQIFCWSCQSVSAHTSPTTGLSLPLSLFIHIRTQTHTITQKRVFPLPYTLDFCDDLG